MAGILLLFLQLATLVFLARAILSWFPIGFDSPIRPIAEGIHRITEPIVGPIRRILPPLGGLDLSVLVVILLIQLLRGVVAGLA